MRTRRELTELIASLPVPEARRELIRLELEDHVVERIAELEAGGASAGDAERTAVESLGDPDVLRARLVEAQLAHAIPKGEAAVLGARTGILAGLTALAASIAMPAQTYEQWLEPHPIYYVAVAVTLFLAFPIRVVRPFLAAHRHAIRAAREGNGAAVKRLQDPMASFAAGLITGVSLPFFVLLIGACLHIPLEGIDGPLLRTIHGAFVVNVPMMTVVTIVALQTQVASRARKTA